MCACADASYGRELTALDEFCARLRKLPSCRASVFVFIIEANLDWMRAKFLAQHVTESSYFPCTTMYEDPKNLERPGVWMTNPRKEQMNNDAMFFLQLNALHTLPLLERPGRNALVSTGTRADTLNTVRMFQDQLKSYRRKLDRASTDPSKEVKARYTGKSAGSKDDMVIAFQLAITWGMAFLDSGEYVRKFNAQPMSVLARLRPPFGEVFDINAK